MFSDKLIAQIKKKRSLVCVGLDPRCEGKEAIPNFILENCKHNPNDAIWQFNKTLIDATHEIAVIYKPQIAFYEQYDALDALKKTIDYIHSKQGLVLLDAKRNDIGTTCDAYAHAAFNLLKADALTINSYFGIDGVAPFTKYVAKGKGVFLLLKTSNKSSGEFQDRFVMENPVPENKQLEIAVTDTKLIRNYLLMTRLMRMWAENPKNLDNADVYGQEGYSSIGGVVGATYPEQMKAIRKEIPKHFILIPGYGAQGGTAKDILHGINADGLGAIVNASRSINYAFLLSPYKDRFTPDQFGEAAKIAAEDMRAEINTEIEKR